MSLDWNQFDVHDLTESHVSVGEWGESGPACRERILLGGSIHPMTKVMGILEPASETQIASPVTLLAPVVFSHLFLL
jgi:hypothetical protein